MNDYIFNTCHESVFDAHLEIKRIPSGEHPLFKNPLHAIRLASNAFERAKNGLLPATNDALQDIEINNQEVFLEGGYDENAKERILMFDEVSKTLIETQLVPILLIYKEIVNDLYVSNVYMKPEFMADGTIMFVIQFNGHETPGEKEIIIGYCFNLLRSIFRTPTKNVSIVKIETSANDYLMKFEYNGQEYTTMINVDG